MSRSAVGQRPSTALEAFFEWEKQACVEIVADVTTDEKTVFIPIERLRAYLTANDNRNLNSILSETFEPEYPPIDPEQILRDHIAVFCILLRIGSGKSIEYFARYEELSDRRLPFDENHSVAEFPREDEDSGFLRRFCETQWRYCVPVFDGFMQHKHFGRQRLLPITKKSFLRSEGRAAMYIVKLYGPQNRLVPAAQRLAAGNPNADTYTLKSYPAKGGESDFRNEVNGYRSVRNADSIIRLYGSYIHRDTLNLLLEFADKGTLEDYFKTQSPPRRGPDIVSFWQGLFQLIKALKAVHSVRQGHLDVKPESILVLSNGVESASEWQFKLADFGVIGSLGAITNDPMLNQMQDHSSYGPPESYAPYNSEGQNHTNTSAKVTWEADIWSLGCIYSEAAIWIADGYQGLLEYRRQRLVETERVLFKAGDCFHDGEKALQSVLDAHAEIEERLRRSDSITKDVLDSMVEEMLWEEDRPNAKALWRKAEMILARTRQKLNGDDSSRPGSSQSRHYPPPRLQPPTQPLPPIPQRAAPYMSSISEQQQHPLNVEKWRSQVLVPPQSKFGRPPSDIASPTLSSRQPAPSETFSDLDRDLAGSVASWKLRDDSSVASPITPFTSPPASVNYDYHRHHPNEGRPRTLQSQSSYEFRRHPALPRAPSYTTDNEYQDQPSHPPPVPRYMPPTPQRASDWSIGPPAPEAAPSRELRTLGLGRAASLASSRHSSAYSGPSTQQHHPTSPDGQNDTFMDALSYSMPEPNEEPAPKSAKRLGGFSLFPTRSRNGSALNQQHPIHILPRYETSIPQSPSIASRSSTNGTAPPMEFTSQGMEYLSLNTCLEWKKAHKKVKKRDRVPPLPGAHILEGLSDRDHAFIIDDAISMAPVWADVNRVFEALSYVVKGMSPDGTELFFTICYDTYRRKETTDLCTHLASHEPKGTTDICYRVNLQLQAYRMALYKAKTPPKTKKVPPPPFTPGVVRPLSLYVLTNGEWGDEGVGGVKRLVQEMDEFLEKEGCGKGAVSVQFISFAHGPEGRRRMGELHGGRGGGEGEEEGKRCSLDCERWTGNVLRMLRGALDVGLRDDGGEGVVNELA